MKSYLIPIVLQIVGILIIMAEIFIPSMGLISIIAISVFGYSLYIVFTEISVTAGIVFVCADIVLIPVTLLIGLKLLAKSPLTLKKELSKETGVVSQASDLETWLDKEGIAATVLRPAGVAVIDGKRLDVVTDGEYIEKDIKIVVTSVTGNQIIVNKLEE